MQKNAGFILMTTLILLLIITLLILNLFSTAGLEAKMAANFQNKATAEVEAENNLKLAETLISRQVKSPANSSNYFWQSWLDSHCPANSTCFKVTAVGKGQHFSCTLQSIYVLEFQTQQNQPILERHYRFSWWPEAC